MKTNKTIWEGRVIRIPFSDFPVDAKHSKLLWINTKKEDRVLIRNIPKNTNTKGLLYQLIDKSLEWLWRNMCSILQTV